MKAYRLHAGPGPEFCVEGNREDDAREVWIVTAATEQAAIDAAIRHAVTLANTGVEVTLDPTRAWLDLTHEDWLTDEELLEQAFRNGLTVLPGEPPVYFWPHDWVAELVELGERG